MNNIIDDKQFTILWNIDDLKTSRVHPAIFPESLLTFIWNMGRLWKWPSRKEKCINTSRWPLITTRLVSYYSWWLNVLERLLVILQDKWRGDHPHLLYTTSSILQKIQPRCPIPTQIFFAIFSTANTSFKEGTSRNPYTSIIPLH